MAQAPERKPVDLSIPDAEIVRRILKGEVELFEIVMRRYNQRLYRACRAILGDDSDAEQVMQDAYVLAYTHLGQFAGKAKFSTWLTKIAVNEALGQRRRRSRFVGFDSLAESGRLRRISYSADQTPEQKMRNRELKDLLESAVNGLPEHYRSVLVMRDIEGLDTAETAECLAISEETVKTRLHRARALMKKQLFIRAGVTRTELFSFQKPRCDRVVEAVFGRIRNL